MQEHSILKVSIPIYQIASIFCYVCWSLYIVSVLYCFPNHVLPHSSMSHHPAHRILSYTHGKAPSSSIIQSWLLWLLFTWMTLLQEHYCTMIVMMDSRSPDPKQVSEWPVSCSQMTHDRQHCTKKETDQGASMAPASNAYQSIHMPFFHIQQCTVYDYHTASTEDHFSSLSCLQLQQSPYQQQMWLFKLWLIKLDLVLMTIEISLLSLWAMLCW